MRVNFGDDSWADIRDPRKLPERLSALVEDAQFALMDIPGMAAFMDEADQEHLQAMSPGEQMRAIGRDGFKLMRELKYANVRAYVQAWSYGAVDDTTMLDVPGVELTALMDEIGKIIKATGGPHIDTSPNPAPDSPTAP